MYDQQIFNQAIADGMPVPLAKLIVAQAKHETGNFSSSVFQFCSNAFGYDWVNQSTANGPCTPSPEGGYYADYSTVEQSTTELTLWIKRRQAQGVFPSDLSTITTPLQYATLLKNADYYGDSIGVYANGLSTWLATLSNLSTTTKAAGTGVLLLIAGAFIFRKKLFPSIFKK